MIRKETGEIRFPNWNASLSSFTTRQQFLRSSLAQDAILHVKNEPYCSWRLKPIKWSDNKWWTVVAYFEDETLSRVLLSASNTETVAGWEDWSEGSEQQKQEYYREVVQGLLGGSDQFSWGRVEVRYDEKSGGSYIVIHY